MGYLVAYMLIGQIVMDHLMDEDIPQVIFVPVIIIRYLYFRFLQVAPTDDLVTREEPAELVASIKSKVGCRQVAVKVLPVVFCKFSAIMSSVTIIFLVF